MGKACNEKRSYETEADAKATADHQKRVNDLDFYAYLCKECGKWHLAPEASRVNTQDSYCFGSNGQPKKCYASQEDALKVAKARGIPLSTYFCDECDGWHLTSN